MQNGSEERSFGIRKNIVASVRKEADKSRLLAASFWLLAI
jgi:hypothetical protein